MRLVMRVPMVADLAGAGRDEDGAWLRLEWSRVDASDGVCGAAGAEVNHRDHRRRQPSERRSERICFCASHHQAFDAENDRHPQ